MYINVNLVSMLADKIQKAAMSCGLPDVIHGFFAGEIWDTINEVFKEIHADAYSRSKDSASKPRSDYEQLNDAYKIVFDKWAATDGNRYEILQFKK
jgi:hypothetical protein